MAEYINFDNALERMLFSMCGTGYQSEAMHAISGMPTIDIVFCKDCKHYETGKEYEPYCNHIKGLDEAKDNDFCSYGERRE